MSDMLIIPPNVAKFEKVSFDEYLRACRRYEFSTGARDKSDDEIYALWDAIKLPARSTRYSAGYDFYAPHAFTVMEDDDTFVPTGIKVAIKEGWFLALLPRSSYGMNYGFKLNNTMGIIDADYFNNPDNEGHIMAKVTSVVDVNVQPGDRFMQGIFIPFGITMDDIPLSELRLGGMGSTGG